MECTKAARNPFCASLSEASCSRLCKEACERYIGRNQTVRVSDDSNRIAIVKEGALSMQSIHVDGKSGVMLFVAIPGDLGNVMRIAGSTSRHPASFNDGGRAFAFVPTRICTVPIDTVRELYRDDPDFAFRIMSKLADYHESTLEQISSTNWMSVRERLQRLIDILEESGIDCSRITHQQLATALGVNRVTITKQIVSV